MQGTIAIAWRLKIGEEGLFTNNLDSMVDILVTQLRSLHSTCTGQILNSEPFVCSDGFQGVGSTPQSVVLLLIEMCR